MIDLETLAVSHQAVILTLGAVHFDPRREGIDDKLYFKIKIDDPEQQNREIDPNTLEWWSKQDPAIMDEAFSEDDRISVVEAVDRFHKFAWGCDAFWSHGSVFDIMIIEDLYRQLKKPVPWNFWQIRDTRTIFDLGIDPEMPQNSKHNALEDAVRQAIGVQNVYRKLKIN